MGDGRRAMGENDLPKSVGFVLQLEESVLIFC
jgi:hypothetical protein